MANLWVAEYYHDADNNQYLGFTEPYETFTDSREQLKEEYMKHHTYIYTLENDEAHEYGWLFSKQEKDDDGKWYTQMTSVEVLSGPDTVVRTRHYA